MCEVSNLQTSPNSKKQPHFWGTFGELKLKKALQIPVTPFSAEREGLFPPYDETPKPLIFNFIYLLGLLL